MGGTIRSEKDVLKLVHPGKYIETFTKPIRAYEVLQKYPKFCITRPDVFKFPWIVVRYDSLLIPGKVFLLLPKHTLYALLKANRPPDGSFPLLFPSPPSCSFSRPSLPLTTNAGTTPKHLTHVRRRLKPPSREDGGIMRSRKNNPRVESWLSTLPPPHVVGNKRTVRSSSSHVHDCYKCGNVVSTDVSRGGVRNGGSRGGKRKTTPLRSCMRKAGSGPRMPNLKVRFSIPNEDIVEAVTKQRTVIESLSKLATTLIVDVCR